MTAVDLLLRLDLLLGAYLIGRCRNAQGKRQNSDYRGQHHQFFQHIASCYVWVLKNAKTHPPPGVLGQRPVAGKRAIFPMYRWKISLTNSLLSAWRIPSLMSIKKKFIAKRTA
ncbi:MAG: hypothetical protein D9V46_10665 [Deltaproteobacteria bacterium]|nr:MAG: hypothetical protein D9V46_10665 [Deltaproteobacteria bacterium]